MTLFGVSLISCSPKPRPSCIFHPYPSIPSACSQLCRVSISAEERQRVNEPISVDTWLLYISLLLRAIPDKSETGYHMRPVMMVLGDRDLVPKYKFGRYVPTCIVNVRDMWNEHTCTDSMEKQQSRRLEATQIPSKTKRLALTPIEWIVVYSSSFITESVCWCFKHRQKKNKR